MSSSNKKPYLTAVDLFCGVGGLAFGLQQAGVHVAAGYDLDPDCRFPFERNVGAKFNECDVRDIPIAKLRSHFNSGDFSLLAGCAPCQPFSTYSRTRKSKDGRWSLVDAFAELAVKSHPDVITMENVPQLARHRVFQNALTSFRKAGYFVSWSIIDSVKYGVPQTRRRLVLIGSRHASIVLGEPQDKRSRTVRDLLYGLPAIAAGETYVGDPLHRSCALSPLNLRRIRSSKAGGSWRDWKPGLRSLCHQKPSGSTFPSVYARMEWDEPAPTMTTQYFGYGNGRFGHPEQDRAISLREGALLQTFPEDYEIEPPDKSLSAQRIGRLIGNAVPPTLARHIGESLILHLQTIAS